MRVCLMHVFDLMTSTLHELAERGQHSHILRKLEREIEVDLDEKVRGIGDPGHGVPC